VKFNIFFVPFPPFAILMQKKDAVPFFLTSLSFFLFPLLAPLSSLISPSMPFTKLREYAESEDLKTREIRAGLTALCCRLGPLIAVPNNGIPFWKLFDLANDKANPLTQSSRTSVQTDSTVEGHHNMTTITTRTSPSSLGTSDTMVTSASTSHHPPDALQGRHDSRGFTSVSDPVSTTTSMNDAPGSMMLVAGDPGFDQLASQLNLLAQSSSLSTAISQSDGGGSGSGGDSNKRKRGKTSSITPNGQKKSRSGGYGSSGGSEHSIKWFSHEQSGTGSSTNPREEEEEEEGGNQPPPPHGDPYHHQAPVLIPLDGADQLEPGALWNTEVNHVPESIMSEQVGTETEGFTLEQLLVHTGILCNAVLMKQFHPRKRAYRFKVSATNSDNPIEDGLHHHHHQPSSLPSSKGGEDNSDIMEARSDVTEGKKITTTAAAKKRRKGKEKEVMNVNKQCNEELPSTVAAAAVATTKSAHPSPPRVDPLDEALYGDWGGDGGDEEEAENNTTDIQMSMIYHEDFNPNQRGEDSNSNMVVRIDEEEANEEEREGDQEKEEEEEGEEEEEIQDDISRPESTTTLSSNSLTISSSSSVSHDPIVRLQSCLLLYRMKIIKSIRRMIIDKSGLT